jgi:hypothetical protein
MSVRTSAQRRNPKLMTEPRLQAPSRCVNCRCMALVRHPTSRVPWPLSVDLQTCPAVIPHVCGARTQWHVNSQGAHDHARLLLSLIVSLGQWIPKSSVLNGVWGNPRLSPLRCFKRVAGGKYQSNQGLPGLENGVPHVGTRPKRVACSRLRLALVR